MTNELPPADLPAWEHTRKHRKAVQETLADRRGTGHVLRELKAERARQDAKWGQQTHPSLTGIPALDWFEAQAEASRNRANHHAANGTLSWDHIMQEEWDEARLEAAKGLGFEHLLRQELVQVMAVAGAWIEDLDRKLFFGPVTAQENEAFQTEVRKAQREHQGDMGGMEPNPFHPGTNLLRDLPSFEREEIDVTTSVENGPYGGMHKVMGIMTGRRGAKVTTLGIGPATKKALEDMGYEVEEYGPGPLYDSVVIKPKAKPDTQAEPTIGDFCEKQLGLKLTPWQRECLRSWDMSTSDAAADKAREEAVVTRPERGKAQAYTVGRVTENGPVVGTATSRLGAAGQPVSSYSGGGVRDVTEGKPRIDLMWPLGVPFEAQMLTRVGLWLERGMRKYAERNWERFHTADALTHALASLNRHLGLYMSGDDAEDHAAAIITNVIFAETIRWKIAHGWEPGDTFAGVGE